MAVAHSYCYEVLVILRIAAIRVYYNNYISSYNSGIKHIQCSYLV